MQTANTMQDDTARRRRIRRNALLLTAFALLVYFGFIVAFVHSRS